MQRKVLEFHRLFRVDAPISPIIPGDGVPYLREKLIQEELKEFIAANAANDLVGAADAIGDLLYVVLGAAVAYGIDIEPIFNEIHRSNMSKAWNEDDARKAAQAHDVPMPVDCGDGRFIVKRADGKVIKAPTYSPADIRGILKHLIFAASGDPYAAKAVDLFGGVDGGSKPGHAH